AAAARRRHPPRPPPFPFLEVEPPTQIREAPERAARGALGDQRLHRTLTHAAYRAEPVADAALAAGREFVARGVAVRRQPREAHGGPLLDERPPLVGGIHVAREQGRHELRRIVGLEV